MERRPLSELVQVFEARGASCAPLAALARALEESGYARKLSTAADGDALVLSPPGGVGTAAGALRVRHEAGAVELSFQRPVDPAPLVRRVPAADAHGAVVAFLTARQPVPPGFAPSGGGPPQRPSAA